MFEFSWPWMGLLLPLPLVIYYLIPAAKNSRQAVLYAPTLPCSHEKAQAHGRSRKLLQFLALLMWLCLVVAAARPSWIGAPVTLERSGRQIMLAVDLSGSMQIEDMQLDGKAVSRLTTVKTVLDKFIAQRQGDQLGLILFADHAYLQAPLTYDLKTVQKFLNEAQIGLVGTQTAIGEGIGLALKRLLSQDAKQRVLILLTDGQNNAGTVGPLQAAKFAAKHGVTIYTIGIGADVMLQRSLFGVQRINPSSDLDSRVLEQIARETGGRYFRAKNSRDIEQAYQTIDKLQPVQAKKETYRPRYEYYDWPLTMALLLSLALIILSRRGVQS
ncbi:vWA domain-containing protein [Dongshaea marina]|uniref:vWA domain-containing protein n=1 Tax=Dongshaea marina TaxID=2047966 RepID=UPI000D3EDB90|nr:VWA domain-containing protein [Dongshaea marina]